MKQGLWYPREAAASASRRDRSWLDRTWHPDAQAQRVVDSLGS